VNRGDDGRGAGVGGDSHHDDDNDDDDDDDESEMYAHGV
jgi:hypothetical protein